MATANVKLLCESTRHKLKEAIGKLEAFLNSNTLPQLAGSDDDAEIVEFYRGFLSDIRHLLVFAEVNYEKLGISLRRPQFNDEYAERVLYDVYHQVVNNFFYPKNECYAEDGRYAYKGEDLIRFRKKPVRIVRNITLEMAATFEGIREDLAYYENDYANERRLRGERA